MYGLDPDTYLWLLAKIEEYIVTGIGEDVERNLLDEKEWKAIMQIARVQTGVPGSFSRYIDTQPCVPEPEEEVANMANAQLCILKNKGEVPDKGILAAAMKQYPSATSIAAIIGEQFVVQKAEGEADVDGIFNMMEAYKDAPYMLHVERATKVQDLQPFTVYGAEDAPVIVVFVGSTTLEGPGFSTFEKPKVPHSGEYNFVMDKVSPFLAKLLTVGDGDLEALVNDLCPDENGQGGEMGTKLRSLMPDGTYMVLFTSTGEIITFGEEAEFPWGTVYGCLEEPVTNGQRPTAPAAPASVPNLLGGKATTIPADDKAIAASLTALYPGVPLAILDTGPVALPKMEAGKAPLVERAPEGNKNAVQAWYKSKLNGKLPTNWHVRPLIPAARQDIVKAGDLKDQTALVSSMKDTAAKHVIVDPGLVFNGDRIKDIKGSFLVKVFGANSEAIANPSTIFSKEMPIASPAIQFSDERLAQPWPSGARYHCCVEYPDLANAIWGDVQNRLKVSLDRIAFLETELNKALEAATKPAEPPSVADTASQPATGNGKTPNLLGAVRRK